MNNINTDILPYRCGVGMMILNKNDMVFVGKRVDTKIDAWQMPQGGIDINEDPKRAVLREMEEEIGSKKGSIIKESKFWYTYDLPKHLIPKLWNGCYRGQRQKWFLIRFTGFDKDINIHTTIPEFNDWKWVNIMDLINIITPFKRKLYKSIIEEFKIYINSKEKDIN